MELSDSHKISQEKRDFKISDVLITAPVGVRIPHGPLKSTKAAWEFNWTKDRAWYQNILCGIYCPLNEKPDRLHRKGLVPCGWHPPGSSGPAPRCGWRCPPQTRIWGRRAAPGSSFSRYAVPGLWPVGTVHPFPRRLPKFTIRYRSFSFEKL